jgi:hypothetical protein
MDTRLETAASNLHHPDGDPRAASSLSTDSAAMRATSVTALAGDRGRGVRGAGRRAFSAAVSALLACCASSVAVAQDECSTAVTAVIGGNTFNTTSATTSPEPVDDSQCSETFLGWGTANKDVWFRFIAPDDGLLTVDTCFAGSFDTSMVLYVGTCGALTQIACNGDTADFPGCQAFYSRIANVEVLAGQTYHVRVGGWTGASGVSESGSGRLNLSFIAANAGCFGAKGSCTEPHASGGCSDIECCSAVCEVFPSCCDAAWSADCVNVAVDLCGLFDYRCVHPSPLVANDCATNAEVLTVDTFRDINTNGCNTDGPYHPASACDSGNEVLFNDIWYRFVAQANGVLTVQTCAQFGGPPNTFDTKVAVYDMGIDPESFDYDMLPSALVGCNDDGDTDCQAQSIYASYLSLEVVEGSTYLIRVGSYDFPGTARVRFDFPEPCALPASTRTEAEACGDNTNGGCGSGGAAESISIGDAVRGTFWITDDGAGNLTRDLDWYRLDLVEDKEVTFNVYSRSFVDTFVLNGDVEGNCLDIIILGRGADVCPEGVTLCLPPGTHYFLVGMDFESSLAACGSGIANDYVLEVTAVDAECPTVVRADCSSPGPNSAWSNNQAPPAGSNNLGQVVACAVNTAFPNCSGGGTTSNKYARVFTSGQLGGEIDCFEVGFFSIRRRLDPANTTCMSYLSDLPLPATVYICRDTDGANPRNVIAAAGDGNDLEVLATREIVVPGMTDTGAIDFDPPLCLDGVTGNIVVVLDCPDLYAGNGIIPAASGYGLRPAGLTVTGQSSQVFVRLSCADSASQFVSAESIGASFTAQWFVGANGNFSGCSANCPADCTRDGAVDSNDLAVILTAWGSSDPGGGPFYPDVDGDGVVGPRDLTEVLAAWGPCE